MSETLLDVTTRLQIKRWDLLLIGDGSGTSAETAGGWCVFAVADKPPTRRCLYGGTNAGSNINSELVPFVMGMNWYHSSLGSERLRQFGEASVHIITDSQYVADVGRKTCELGSTLPQSHTILWGALRTSRMLGYEIDFHWVPRLSVGLNAAADAVAGLLRRLFLDGPPAAAATTVQTRMTQQAAVLPPVIGEQINPFPIVDTNYADCDVDV